MNYSEIMRRILLHWPALIAATLIVFNLLPIEGKIGHDYYHQFSRFFYGVVHFWKNGFSIPHYSALLCGGLPYFADPQSAYYSFPQWLSFFIDPYLASLVTSFLFSLLGYLGCFLWLKKGLNFSQPISQVGALVFQLNGFSYAHLLVGHLTHHTFFVLPWFLYWLFTASSRTSLRGATLMALLASYLFYSGGMHILVVTAVLGLLVLPLLLLGQSNIEQKRTLKLLALALTFFLMACIGKLVAGVAYSKHFVHSPIDRSAQNFLTILIRYFWFHPKTTPLTLPFGNWQFGAWEYVAFLSKSTLASFILFVLWVFSKRNPHRVFSLALGLFCVFVLAVCLGRGGNEFIALLKSYHNPIKLLSAFVLPLIWILCWVLQQSLSRTVPPVLFGLVVLFLLGEFHYYCQFFRSHRLGVHYPYQRSLYDRLQAEQSNFHIRKIITKRPTDVSGAVLGTSSLGCNEPLFGYRLERFYSPLKAGPVLSVSEGKFNFHHPGCFLYPNYFGCQAWERVKEGDRKSLVAFTQGESTAWGVPLWQRLLLYLSGTWLILMGGISLCSRLRSRKERRSEQI